MERSARLQTIALALLGAFAWLSFDLASLQEAFSSYFAEPAAAAPAEPRGQVEVIEPSAPGPAQAAAAFRAWLRSPRRVHRDTLEPDVVIEARPLKAPTLRVHIARNTWGERSRLNG